MPFARGTSARTTAYEGDDGRIWIIIHDCAALMGSWDGVLARGHGEYSDEILVDQVVEFGNAKNGVKMRFGHPVMSSTALGTLIGFATNFEKVPHPEKAETWTAKCDVHLSPTAEKGEWDRRAYIVDMAEQHPDAFALSISAPRADKAWRDPEENYISSEEYWEMEREDRKLCKGPFARIANLSAIDFVDEGAVTHDGLLAQFSGRFDTSVLASQAMQTIDVYRLRHHIELDDMQALVGLWLASHGEHVPYAPTVGTVLSSAEREAIAELDQTFETFGESITFTKAAEVFARYFEWREQQKEPLHTPFITRQSNSGDTTMLEKQQVKNVLLGSGLSEAAQAQLAERNYADMDALVAAIHAARTNSTQTPATNNQYQSNQGTPQGTSDDDETDWVALEKKQAKKNVLMGMLRESGLPKISQDELASRNYNGHQDMVVAIESKRQELAQWAEMMAIDTGGGAPRQPVIYGYNMRTGEEEVRMMVRDLVDENYTPPADLITFSGPLEAYKAFWGNDPVIGEFNPARRSIGYTAAAERGHFPQLLAEEFNKVFYSAYANYGRPWEECTVHREFKDLRDVNWKEMGEAPRLFNVEEGKPYGTIKLGERSESFGMHKEGGIFHITLETWINDDLHVFRDAPKKLASALWKSVLKDWHLMFLLNGGAGPTMSDGKPFYHSSRNNVAALPFNYQNWTSIGQTLYYHKELGSGDPLGGLTAPKKILHNKYLEDTIIRELGSALIPHSANNTINTAAADNDSNNAARASIQKMMITMPFWPNQKHYRLLPDKKFIPSFGMGTLKGHKKPMLVQNKSEKSPLMFDRDVWGYKIRYFYGFGAINPSGSFWGNPS